MRNPTPWDVQDFLLSPQNCAQYLQAAIDEAGDDADFIAKTLDDVARAGNLSPPAHTTGNSGDGL